MAKDEDEIKQFLNGEGEHTYYKIITLHINRKVVNVVLTKQSFK